MRAGTWHSKRYFLSLLAAALVLSAYFANDFAPAPPSEAMAGMVRSPREEPDVELPATELSSAPVGSAQVVRAETNSKKGSPSPDDPVTKSPSSAASTSASSVAGCGTTPSSYREFSRFSAERLPGRWGLNPARSQPDATLVSTRRGPATNPALCAQGCAVLSVVIRGGTDLGGGAVVDEWFSNAVNLYGAVVRVKLALELQRPNLPVNVRIFAQGDLGSGYSQGNTASISTPTLADLSSFHEVVLRPMDRKGKNAFCASATGAIGIQIRRSYGALVDIPAKLYIHSVTIGDAVQGELASAGTAARSPAGSPLVPIRLRTPGFTDEDGNCRLADDGALSVALDDWVTAGTCQGYGYTYAMGHRADTKIVPTCTASRCTPRLAKMSSKGLCSSGTIAADPTWQSKAAIGLDLDPTKAKTAGLSLRYQMTGTSILRLVLEDTEGTQYCTDLDETEDSGATVNVPWEALTTRCWDSWAPGDSYNPSLPMNGVQLSASCLADKNSWFDMCIFGLATF